MKFASLDSYTAGGRTTFFVHNNEECYDFAHIIGKTVMIDGVLCDVIGVDRYTHLPPFRKGDVIGLVINA